MIFRDFHKANLYFSQRVLHNDLQEPAECSQNSVCWPGGGVLDPWVQQGM